MDDQEYEVVASVVVESRSEDSVTLEFSVADTGIGIPPEKRRSIFEPFEQADGSTTRRYGGTGLGLTISAKLVALMGGRIAVDEAPGGGSIFRFTARFALDHEARPPRRDADPTSLEGVRVLIVDDNRTNRLILEEVLTQWGASPTAVDGGPAALAALAEGIRLGLPFSVVLLDQMMPEMDGLTLAAAIRNDPRFAGLAIALLTSGTFTDDTDLCRKLGIAPCLIKPVHQSKLFDAMMDILGTSSNRGPRREPAAGTPGSQTLPSHRRVLLAEDNLVNQRVAVELLKGLGQDVVVACDGRQAVDAFETGKFDLVLMDVQMPRMDGFEALAAIRVRESVSGGHVPVVALTAHAMKGDRERCLAAGFDGYLSKPIQVSALRELLLGRDVSVPSDRPAAAEDPDDVQEFDRTAALASVGGDASLLAEIIEIFLDDYPRRMAQAREAIDRGDFVMLRRVAHTVRGALSHFAANSVGAKAHALEELSQQGDRPLTENAFAALELALDRIHDPLAEFAASLQAPSTH